MKRKIRLIFILGAIVLFIVVVGNIRWLTGTALVETIRFFTGAAGLPDLDEARKLAREGKYEEALQKHLWFYEKSKNSIGMGGVRLSYALDDWLKLANQYPPAKKALIETRDKNEKIILEGNGTFDNFHDFSSINDVLGEEEKTLKLFLEIHKTQPQLAVHCFIVAKDLLVEKKEYKICSEYIKDPIKEFEDIRDLREKNISLMRKSSKLNIEQMRTWTEDTYAKSTCQLIEILLATGKKKEAEDIQKRALEYHSNEKIKGINPNKTDPVNLAPSGA